MTKKKTLTVTNVTLLLCKKGLISEEQQADILARADAQAARLGGQQAGHSRRIHAGADQLSPAEIISSFNLEIPHANGRILTEDAITEEVARATGLDYVKIDPLKLELEMVTGCISRPYALKHLLVPLTERNGIITVAVADPFCDDVIRDLEETCRFRVQRVLASRSDILKILREFFGFRTSVLAAESEAPLSTDLGNLEQFVRLKGHSEIESSDQHIVAAVEYLLSYAYEQRASDIHIEPKRERSLVRLRIDGVLHNIHSIPKQIHAPIVSRIKLLSRLDLAEKRRPQDGRIKTDHKGKEVELRVSTLPVAFGEKVVIRIFDPEVLMQDLDSIGFYPREFQLYNFFIHRPNGIILVTGPTGSGKTTTLYSSLRALSSPEVNIVTVEDPIEMVMEEFNQVGVQSGIGVSFATSLRTILRQDPDIIMIGEIRDKETAENAVQAALTGHLVLSTLHTNDAPTAITRLLDLGIPSFLIGSTLIGVVAQRLLRQVCPYCRRQRTLSDTEAAHLGLGPEQYLVWEGEGCSECRGTGYRGRTGIFEVMDCSEGVKGVLKESADLDALQKAARADGMDSLRDVAIRKMLEGVTTYEEVVGMTG